MNSNQSEVERLRWKKFPVLNDGFVTLVDVMGDDYSVVQAARVSYGKDARQDNTPVTDEGILREKELAEGDRNLIRYLMRHRHTTPFEMAEVKILVRVPMDCWRQWIRHRTANVNEYSTRYTEAIDSCQTTPPDAWRLQSGSNKQGSSGYLSTDPAGPDGLWQPNGIELSAKEEEFQGLAREVYESRLKKGIAREQARKDLPLSTYTEAYWKCDLHNVLHFLALRMDSHAQKEIRDYATVIGQEIIKPLFPLVWEAFEDYRLGAMYLTRLDVEVIGRIVGNKRDPDWPQVPWRESYGEMSLDSSIWPEAWRGKEKHREREECLQKLRRLRIID